MNKEYKRTMLMKSSSLKLNDENKYINNTTENKKIPKLHEQKSVAFTSAEIVEFEPTLWTASVTSGGFPIGMSIKERKRSRRRLNSYEDERKECRITREKYMEMGYLEPEERREILVSIAKIRNENEFELAEFENEQIIDERRETNEEDLQFQYGLGQSHMIEYEMDIIENENERMKHMNSYNTKHELLPYIDMCTYSFKDNLRLDEETASYLKSYYAENQVKDYFNFTKNNNNENNEKRPKLND